MFSGAGNGSVGAGGPDITPSGGTFREGEAFTFEGLGDMTGFTGLSIEGVACTSVVFDDVLLGNGSAVAPTTGVVFDKPVPFRGAA